MADEITLSVDVPDVVEQTSRREERRRLLTDQLHTALEKGEVVLGGD